MADDVTITSGANSTPPAGTVIATDDVGSKHYQRVKLDLGGDGVSIPIDKHIPVIDYPHFEIHGGDGHAYIEVIDQTENHVYDIQMTTGASTKWKHLVFYFDTEAETEWYLYENVTISTPGTATTPRNHNRNVADNTTLTIKVITNTTTANANADTAVASATILAHGIAGAGKKIGGEGTTRQEWILKQSEDYTLRFIATAAGFVSFHLDWYEHTE